MNYFGNLVLILRCILFDYRGLRQFTLSQLWKSTGNDYNYEEEVKKLNFGLVETSKSLPSAPCA